MTPKEKALELVDKFQFILTEKQFGKQCALITVDEIVKEINIIMIPNPFKQYWNKVKQEIEKL